MNIILLSTDMLLSPEGPAWTRFQVASEGRQFLDFSAPNERIRTYEDNAKKVLVKHGANALRNRVTRDFKKAMNKLIENDTNAILELIIMSRIADGKPVTADARSVN